MRVIAGTARGMKLKAPRGHSVRPTGDRVKESLFNIIGPRIQRAVFLDLFAGSGAVGIEALSRGAESCVFVEKHRAHLQVIKENIQKAAFTSRSRVLGFDAKGALELLNKEGFQADIIFLDPPYLSSLVTQILEALYRYDILQEQGLIIIEHNGEKRDWADTISSFRDKKYGGTYLTFVDKQGLGVAPAEENRSTDSPHQVKHNNGHHQEPQED